MVYTINKNGYGYDVERIDPEVQETASKALAATFFPTLGPRHVCLYVSGVETTDFGLQPNPWRYDVEDDRTDPA